MTTHKILKRNKTVVFIDNLSMQNFLPLIICGSFEGQ